MNQIIMWIMAVGAVLGGVDRIAGNRFGFGKRFEEGFTLLGPTALSMSGIICLTPLLSRFLRFALVPIWNFFGLDAGLLAGILAIDMGGYQLAGELSASQEMVRYAGLVIAATLGCTITFTIPVGMGMLKSGDRLFFSRGMLIGTGTLPVTMASAENRLGIRRPVSRFVLPICTTINMNGCAAFILLTVVYLMQNAGADITFGTIAAWVLISTIAAVGNAGVPMGCFFLSASLLASMNVPILLMGVILPFYAVIDAVETTLNVWSDSCVAAMVNKDLYGEESESSAEAN